MMLKRLRCQRNISKEVIIGGGGWMMRQKEGERTVKHKVHLLKSAKTGV